MAEAKLGKCPRCGNFALVDKAQGVALAVDLLPVDALGFGSAVAGGIRLWWVETGQKRPSRVVGPLRGDRNPSWGPGGAQASIQKLHQEHACGAAHRDIAIVQVEAPKGSAPATPGAAEAGNHRRAARVAGARARGGPSPATTATPRRSDPRGRCGVCNRPIHPGVEAWSITHGGEFVYGEHVDCE